MSARKLMKWLGQGSGLIKRVVELLKVKTGNQLGWYWYQRGSVVYRSDSILTKYSQDRKELLLNHSLDTDCNQKDGFWGKNEHFHLKPVAKNVLLSSNAWLNPAQVLYCKSLETQDYQCCDRWTHTITPQPEFVTGSNIFAQTAFFKCMKPWVQPWLAHPKNWYSSCTKIFVNKWC